MFKLRADRFYFNDNLVRLDGLPAGQYVYSNYHTNTCRADNIKYTNVSISIDNLGRYWLSFNRKKSAVFSYIAPDTKAIGIDINVYDTIVDSNGNIYRKPNTERLERRKKLYQRRCCKDIERKKKLERTNPDIDNSYSKNVMKRKFKYRKVCKKIHNINQNFYHATVKKIVQQNPTMIVL